MATIDVDFEVYKELTLRRRSEAMTENDVIRELLGLEKRPSGSAEQSGNYAKGGPPWVVKGVEFPSGTPFRATYKGRQYQAKARNGALEMAGKRYKSPSAAAVEITGNPVNGWRFWECRMPGTEDWRVIAAFRD